MLVRVPVLFFWRKYQGKELVWTRNKVRNNRIINFAGGVSPRGIFFYLYHLYLTSSWYYAGISLWGELKKITKHLIQDGPCPGLNSNRTLSE
jgi:hypothetical protein